MLQKVFGAFCLTPCKENIKHGTVLNIYTKKLRPTKLYQFKLTCTFFWSYFSQKVSNKQSKILLFFCGSKIHYSALT